MFTIIIPLYNKAPYVAKAIQSVADQTFQEFELIVIDDGSKDESFEIAQKVMASLTPPLGFDVSSAERGWGVYRQENQGVSIARNNGVKLAKFPNICFLDADDWWEPTFLEEMKELIEEFPEAGIYGSGYNIVKNNKKRVAPIGVEPNLERGIINYCQVYAKTLCMPLWTGATIIKRSIFEIENGFKPILKLGEDFDLWIRVAMKYPVAFLNKPLANYNQDVASANRAIGEKLYAPSEQMLFTDYGELNTNTDFRNLYHKLALYGLMPYYLTNKSKEEVELILSEINWSEQPFKYRLYYRMLPKSVVRMWMEFLKLGSHLKKSLIANH